MSIIRIKRSTVSGNPGTLANGELAYSGLTNNGSNGGDRLYIGLGTETGGNAANHYVVGGKYYTDLMAGTAGTLNVSASTSFGSVPILSQTGTIDQWLVGNLKLTGNTLSTTNSGGNLILSPNGAGLVQINGTWTLPATAGTNGYVLTTNGSGVASWQQSSSNLSIAGTAGTGSISLLTQSLTVTGNSAISTNASNQSITVSVATATTSVLGVASFSSANFTVNSGAVSITNGGITNAQLTASTITINGTAVSIGTSATISAVITNPLTISTGLNGTSYNGSSAVTIWLNTATLMASAATAYSLANTSTTYVGRSVLADSATTATSAATAYSLANTSTTYVGRAVLADTATTATSAATAYSLANTSTTYVGRAVLADTATTATSAATAYALANTSTTYVGRSVLADTATTATSAATAYALANTSTTYVGRAVLADTATTATSAATAYSLVGGIGVATLTGSSGTSVSASTGAVTVWFNTATLVSSAISATTATSAATAYSLANTSTTYVGRSVLADSATTAAFATTATSAATAYSWVGGVVGNTSTFNAPVTFSFPVTFNGTSTYVLSTNTIYTDNLIELHTPPGGVGSFWNSDDGKDIGLRFHYYTNSTDTNAALVLANDTKMLEFYNSGAESITGTFAGASYGGFKLGNIQLVSTTANSNNATSGALTVAGGVGVGGSIFVSGVVTATTFIGALTGTASTATSAATAYALANTSTTYVGRSVLADTATTATSAATAYALSYTIQPAGGGTGVTTYAAYDLLYGTTSGPLGKLTMGTAGQVLQVNTSGSALIYGDIDGGTY